jgi:hypothetical protein
MNIIELAQKCQLIGMRPHLDGIYQNALEKFAELIAAQEREACAKIADVAEPYKCADLIRARGKV